MMCLSGNSILILFYCRQIAMSTQGQTAHKQRTGSTKAAHKQRTGSTQAAHKQRTGGTQTAAAHEQQQHMNSSIT
jgi:hypothetical protein